MALLGDSVIIAKRGGFELTFSAYELALLSLHIKASLQTSTVNLLLLMNHYGFAIHSDSLVL